MVAVRDISLKLGLFFAVGLLFADLVITLVFRVTKRTRVSCEAACHETNSLKSSLLLGKSVLLQCLLAA